MSTQLLGQSPKKIMMLLGSMLLTACATGYKPVVDPAAVTDARKYQMDTAECQYLAQENTKAGTRVAENSVAGGAVGTGAGALLGVISGNTTKGLATGAVIGGLAGLLKGGQESEEVYRQIFRNCMRGRGYNVLN